MVMIRINIDEIWLGQSDETKKIKKKLHDWLSWNLRILESSKLEISWSINNCKINNYVKRFTTIQQIGNR